MSVTHAYWRAAGQVDGASSLDQGFQEATLLADELRRLELDAVSRRGKIAGEIRERFDLTLDELAQRLGVSKSTAARLIRYARRDDDAPPEGE